MADHRAVIVLAAGKGKRMKSDLPKVLHRINDQPMICFLMDTLVTLNMERTAVVIGYKGEMVKNELANYPVSFVWQREQLGTGHAVMMAKDVLGDFQGTTIVVLGDVPFLSAASINLLLAIHEKTGASATCLSAVLDDPVGYGRIVREGQSDILNEIVEHRDASEEILAINEINTGTFCFDNQKMFEALEEVGNSNSQGEYYLTDTIKILHDNGLQVAVATANDPDEVRGVNSVEQLELLVGKFSEKNTRN